MSTETTARFKDAIWLQYQYPITIIGIGGIGSWVAFLLFKMGYKLEVYEFDTLERLNIGSQLYPEYLVGKPKTTALLEMFKDFSEDTPENNVLLRQTRFGTGSHLSPITICAVDNMETRKLSANMWKNKLENNSFAEGTFPLFIDGRMDAETLEVFSLTSVEDYIKYKEHLFEDSEVEDAPCTFKATPYTAALIASRITSVIVNHITNQFSKDSTRNVPFHIQEIIPLMLSQTI